MDPMDSAADATIMYMNSWLGGSIRPEQQQWRQKTIIAFRQKRFRTHSSSSGAKNNCRLVFHKKTKHFDQTHIAQCTSTYRILRKPTMYRTALKRPIPHILQHTFHVSMKFFAFLPAQYYQIAKYSRETFHSWWMHANSSRWQILAVLLNAIFLHNGNKRRHHITNQL